MYLQLNLVWCYTFAAIEQRYRKIILFVLMAIILDAHARQSNTYEAYLEKTLFTTLAAGMPGEIFLCSETEIADFPGNVKPVRFPPESGLFLQKKNDKWLQAQGGSSFISFKRTLSTTLPVKQVLIIAAERLISNEKVWHRADAIGFTSGYLQSNFNEKYPSLVSKTFLAEGIVQEAPFLPDEGQKQLIKEAFTDSREYFITTDFDWNKEKLVMLLKAFSRFKKMQQSNWVLMIAIRSGDPAVSDMARELLTTYKYRADIVLTDDDRMYEKIAAAYSLISICTQEIFPVPVEEALKMHKPVIALETQIIRNRYGGLVVYPSGDNSEAVSDMLMMMYKGETYRQNLIKNISARSTGYNAENISATLKQLLSRK